MTQIYFYSGSRNKLITACRLCAKALQKHMRILVFIPDSSATEQFDELLWTFAPVSFVPHCDIHDDPQMVQATPVILSNRIPSGVAFEVLLNLDRQSPPAFDQFNRVIEIAGNSADDKLAARDRYRFYKNAGYDIQHFQLSE